MMTETLNEACYLVPKKKSQIALVAKCCFAVAAGARAVEEAAANVGFA